MTMINDFEALTFDCYGTLIDWETGLLCSLQPWLQRHRKRPADEAVLAGFAAAETRLQAAAPAKRYPEILADAMRTLGDLWGVPVSDAQAQAFGASIGTWPAFDDSAPALRELKRHCRLAILSNVDRASFAISNRQLGVEFDHVYTAEDIGSYKPDLRNFHFALQHLSASGIEARRVLHVAQSLYHDHVPAKRLGLATVWIDRRAGKPGGGATPPAEAVPDWRFESMAAFASELRRQRAARRT